MTTGVCKSFSVNEERWGGDGQHLEQGLRLCESLRITRDDGDVCATLDQEDCQGFTEA